MVELHVDIPTADGSMNSFVVHPEEGGPHPVVLFYMDAPGKREELHDMARRIAATGYFVVLPNLYYRRSRDYVLKERTEPLMAEMFEHMRSLNRHTNARDTRAMLAYVDCRPDVADGRRIAGLGYCMSGPFVVWAAADYPQRFACIASIHGANMATAEPDSPHRVAAQLRCESYMACAQTDIWAPPEHIAQFEAGLRGSGQPYRLEWYPGAEHGFVFPGRAAYHRASAERHWERILSLFDRKLRAR
ncbi:MAG: dienelactone hydrolase family protein [Burkholderiaceae bacterium]